MTIEVAGVAATDAQKLAIAQGLDGAITACVYNGSGQLISFTQYGVAFTLTYASGLLATKTGGGRTITYTYDSSSRLTGQVFS